MEFDGPDPEEFNRDKNLFKTFFESQDGGAYMDKIRGMMDSNSRRLAINIDHVRAYQPALANSLLRQPSETILAAEAALKDVALDLDPAYGKDTNVDREFRIAVEGSFGHNHLSPRGLLASFLCQMVCIEGIVTKCSLVRPKTVRSVHYCPATNQMITREYRDQTFITGPPTSQAYPTKDDTGNPLETEFGLCTYKDYQTLVIQEMPERAPLGQLPRAVEVIIDNDLVDRCKPGDRIRVVGVYRAMAGSGNTTSAVFRICVIANNIQLLDKEVNGIVMTTDDIANIRSLAKREEVVDILSRSMAPSIYGHQQIKKALLLQLLGGVEKNLSNGTHLRGDINVLLVGDPSTAKSQLLRFVLGTAPLAVNTTGRGSSGVGLTAAVTRDIETKERRLEAGAMVLADRGIVCIDEFDKMSETDRVAIHEVMEQQTVTIAKAGIHASLNARCSVLAAANPVSGQYDKSRKPQENIGLPDSLLSRFDLLFIVLDKLDIQSDRRISEHVLRMHRYQRPGMEGIPVALDSAIGFDREDESQNNGNKTAPVWQKFNPLLHSASQDRKKKGSDKSKDELLSMDFLKKYIHYAKSRIEPVLSDDARERIADGYADLREKQSYKTLPVTARSLETLIRLASAHAKARLSGTVESHDAEVAIGLVNFALFNDTQMTGDKDADYDSCSELSDEESEEEQPEGLDTPRVTRKEQSKLTSKKRKSPKESDKTKRFRVTATAPADRDGSQANLTARLDVFNKALQTVARKAEETEILYADEALEGINEQVQPPFSHEEFEACLMALEKKNRVMYNRTGGHKGSIHFL